MAKTMQKRAKTGIKEGIEQDKLLTYLDHLINDYYQNNNVWPGKIILSQETKDKIFEALDLETLDNSWKDKRDNYKGIPIEIKKDITLIELKGV